MNTMAMQPHNTQKDRHDMKSPLVASLVLHGFLILLFSGAFFFFSKPIEIPEEPLSVEILPIAEKAQSMIDAPIAKKLKPMEEVKDEPPPMPKATEAKQPAKSEPEKREKIEEIRPTEPLKKPEAKPEKKVEPKPEKVVTKKPEPAKKEEVKEAPKKEEAEFSSVLKNLVGDEEAPPQPNSIPRDTPRQAPQLTAPAPLGSALSMSEMDMLRSQLAQCWNVIAGARDADNLAVDIAVTVAADKTVTSARVVDQLRYSTDGLFRAAADSAMRALRSPTCTPLKLPDAKYEQWKSMTVQFDPKNMF